MNRLTTRGAAEIEPTASSAVRMFTHPLWSFFNFYILVCGFLDGGYGLYAATTAAFYVFLKYSKVYVRYLESRHPK
jgi:hypothetical protein